jgi:beta-xylosidase
MAILARSKSVEGPWENSPYNPIVRTWSQEEPWWRQGHGTLIDDADGKWWFFYTGYEKNYTEYGKQTLLLPVEWTADGWPRVVPGATAAAGIFPKPTGENVGHGMPLSDDFSGTTLGIQWQYGQAVNPGEAFELGGGTLAIRARGKIPGEAAVLPVDAEMLSVMPVNHAYEAQVEISVPETAEGGLLLGGGFRGSGTWATAGIRKGQAFATWAGQANYNNWKGNRIMVRLRNRNHDVSAFYSSDGKAWTQFANSTYVTDGRRLSLYAAGEGRVRFRNFQYRGLD